MRISDIGEFGLIDRIDRALGPPGAGVVVGIGDDVAVLRGGGQNYLLATCDIQVEGIHFLKEAVTPYQLGRKAVAINLSDIASMGGWPTYLLVSLALPKETEVGYVDGLYEGLREESEAAGAEIVGGNLSHSERGVMVDIFLLGEVEPDHLLLRSGARVGDRILVTGQVGDSGAGLALLLNPSLPIHEEERERVLRAHFTPTPRLKEGRAIAASGMATAMIDISDGLASDLGHICERSGVGALIEAQCERSGVGALIEAQEIPLSLATKAIAGLLDKDPLDFALHGGEDYQLLFTARPEKAEELAKIVREETGTPVSIIGQIRPPQEGMRLALANGEIVPLMPKGWDHFRR